MATPSPLTPAQTQLKTFVDGLSRAKNSFSAVAAKTVTADRLIKIAIAAAQRNPTLLQCTQQSIVRAIMQGAELGLTPGSALNSAYLVPFKNKNGTWEAQLIVSAQGLCELAYRSGLVSYVYAEVVYKGDEFHYELGFDTTLRHVPTDESIDAADITHAYMVVALKDGGKVFRVMTRKAIDRIMGRSPSARSGSSPWSTDYAEMAKKTVIKNGMKYVPKSIEVAKAISLDNAQETDDFSALDFEIPEALPEGTGEGQVIENKPGAVTKLAEKIGGGEDPATLLDPNAPDEVEGGTERGR